MLYTTGSKFFRFALSMLLLALVAACATAPEPFFDAAERGDIRSLKSQLESGTSLDKRNPKGETALMVVARNNNEPATKFLLSKGSDVNSKDKAGFTTLMAASEGGNIGIVNSLLARGARVNDVSTDGTTALLAAAQKGRVSVVDILLMKGADMNAKDKDGMTALGYAKKNKFERLTKYLVDAGAKE